MLMGTLNPTHHVLLCSFLSEDTFFITVQTGVALEPLNKFVVLL